MRVSAILLVVCMAAPALAQEAPPPDHNGTLSLTFENDIFGGTDRNYTTARG